MRLSDLLNRAPEVAPKQVENFLGGRKIGWGQHKKIAVGRVVRNLYCRSCSDLRTYTSGESLLCLVAGEKLVSIDAVLKCPTCESSVETWYVIASDGDLYGQAPVVHLERFTENRHDAASASGAQVGQVDDLLERAQLAYDSQLGAGAMVYLRKIFETITSEVATVAGISTRRSGGGRKTFQQLLKEVDGEHHIVPAKFSRGGYKLFSELSEVIHGGANEEVALLKYAPCRQLILSVINNVQQDQAITRAIDSLGWDPDNLAAIVGQEVTP